MKHEHQHYALDENKNIINAKNALKNQKYFCPSCKSEMILKQGNIRKWHFAHKTDSCSYDNYLHSLAKIMIANWLTKSKTINLEMNCYNKCDHYKICKIYSEELCVKTNSIEYDLKKYYNSFILEHKYNGFIADIFCEHEKTPIFIEIYVTHKCSEYKKTSGIKIIEIKIESEEDIINIINSQEIKEDNKIVLYNFNPKEKTISNITRDIQKFILYPSYKAYINKSLNCMNYNAKRKGIYEISTIYDDCIPYFLNSGGFYIVGKAMAYQDGYLKQDCQLCKWQGIDSFDDAFCILYKKCGNPKYCDDNNALECNMFKVDNDKINNAIDEFNQHKQNEWVDIYKA